MPYYPALIGITTSPRLDQTAAFAFSHLGLTHIDDTTQSTSSTTGSLTTAGGLGVAKDAFFANKLTTFNDIATTGGSYIASANGAFQWAGKGGLTQPSTAVLQLGFANAASPAAQTVQAQGSRSGTDTNVAGANLTIASGQGTGNSTGSSLIFQTPAAVASGTGAQTMTTRLTLDPNSVTVSGVSLVGGSDGVRITSVGDLAVYNAGKIGWSSNSSSSGTVDTILTRSAAATLQFGAANAASPVAQTVQAQGSRAGTDSNVGGANLTVTAGNGTGTGTLSSLILQSPRAVAGGSGAQTQTTGLTIKDGQAVHPSYTVATLPTGIFGGVVAVTDGDAGLAWGATVINSGAGATRYLVWFNNTNWTVMGK